MTDQPPTETARAGPHVSVRRRLIAAARLRCPRCCRGRVFHGSFAMHVHCPECGLRYEREQGYFFGAMYFSYLLAFLVLAPLYYLCHVLFPTWEPQWALLLAYAPFLFFVPLVFRYSRICWLHFDHWASPSSVTDSASWERWCREHPPSE